MAIAVTDGFNPWNNGAYLLETDGTEAECTTTSLEPDITITASDLGAIYMGGVRLLTLAAAGRVKGSPEAIARADAMFLWHPAPWCPEVF